jgi:hypothetical protein
VNISFKKIQKRRQPGGLSGAACEDFSRGPHKAFVAFRGNEIFDGNICFICVDAD